MYNSIIQELAKNVLRISKRENNSNEVALTYSMDSTECIQNEEEYIGVALGGEHEVDPLSCNDFKIRYAMGGSI